MFVPALRQNSPSRRLEFGIYRDGDNNLDLIQSSVLKQAQAVSRHDGAIEFSIEDATSRNRNLMERTARTERYTIADGNVVDKSSAPLENMSKRENLAHFVARTLDNAQRAGAKQTWIELVNHGAGDGGGIESDSFDGLMNEDDIAGAIADGVAQHAREHPEDVTRGVDGIVANQCLMATLGMESALSHAGVKWLAASPETMLAPGAPSVVAQAIADAPSTQQMGRDVVDATMDYRYAIGGEAYGPAAAFDVLDLDPKKIATMERSVTALNGSLIAAANDFQTRRAIKEDARAIEGMTRRMDPKLPWHADRPAIELYHTLAEDGRLPQEVRNAANAAAGAVAATILAHRESDEFRPFNGVSYADAVGPTVHFPAAGREIDPWAPKVSETSNAFYQSVDGMKLAKALA